MSDRCRQLVFARTAEFFGFSAARDDCDESLSVFIRRAEKAGYVCRISCPKFFILSPMLWLLFWRNWVPYEEFDSLSAAVRPRAVIHLASAFSIYGIEEFWTHFVSEMISETGSTYFDPYLVSLTADYPALQSYQPPNVGEFLYNYSIRTLIFKRI